MKVKYEKPSIEIVEFEIDSLITASATDDTCSGEDI